MPMSSYPVVCYTPDCEQLAKYKIAARWSDGFTEELKTYGLSCETCLARWFAHAKQRQSECRLSEGEEQEAPGIYLLERGVTSSRLTRCRDAENGLEGRDMPLSTPDAGDENRG